MYIKNLSLVSFRNLNDINIIFNDNINIFYGQNAQGKTNILEAIFLCSTGRSHRTRYDKELIMFDKNESHIRVLVSKNNLTNKIDVHLKKEGKKGIAVNNIPIKKIIDLMGKLHAVIFSPEDLNLIKSGPSERRRFMDMELCQISNVYYFNLQQYYKVLKQRNKLLKSIQKNKDLKSTLNVWDTQLLSYGSKIISFRENFINKINDIAFKNHLNITSGIERLKISYSPDVLKNDFELKLKKSQERDLIYATTFVGPHRDDIDFYINDKNIKIYGSQGQQRTAALCTKLAQLELIEKETLQKPILLLDDVFSELDESRQFFLMQSIKEIQTFITCTGIEDSIKKYVDSSFLFKVQGGSVKKI